MSMPLAFWKVLHTTGIAQLILTYWRISQIQGSRTCQAWLLTLLKATHQIHKLLALERRNPNLFALLSFVGLRTTSSLCAVLPKDHVRRSLHQSTATLYHDFVFSEHPALVMVGGFLLCQLARSQCLLAAHQPVSASLIRLSSIERS